MSDEPSSVAPAELIDAFFHRPRLVNIGYRSETTDGDVLIVSHAELWPWRVVLRGLRANKRAVNSQRARVTAPVAPDDSSGTLSGSVVELTQAARDEHRARTTWYTEWSVRDDLSTEYRMVGAGDGGSGGEIWSDFCVEFHPTVPPSALTLTFDHAAGESIEVRLATRDDEFQGIRSFGAIIHQIGGEGVQDQGASTNPDPEGHSA